MVLEANFTGVNPSPAEYIPRLTKTKAACVAKMVNGWPW